MAHQLVQDVSSRLSTAPKQLLEQLVKTLQRHGMHLLWEGHVQNTAKSKDPAKASEQVLRSFILSIVQPNSIGNQNNFSNSCQQQSAAPSGNAAQTQPTLTPEKQQFYTQLVQQYLEYEAQIAQEKSSGATSAPRFRQGQTPDKLDAWQLVHATRKHFRYQQSYSLNPYVPGWSRTARKVVEQACPPPRLLALDCEMVKTEDDSSMLVNLTVVDEQGKVVYSSMVRPEGIVVDYCTDITGLTAQDLQYVTISRDEARQTIEKILAESWHVHKRMTILIGHSLHNDLKALRLDYQPVIDTALIFTYEGMPTCTPGLRDLHNLVLGSDMEARATGRHDSAEDARAAMKLVLHELQQGCRTQALKPPGTKADRDQLSQLLVHNIPEQVTEDQLLQLFAPMVGTSISQQETIAAPVPVRQQSHGNGKSSSSSSSSSTSDSDDSSSDDSDVESNALHDKVKKELSAMAPVTADTGKQCISQMPVFATDPAIQNKKARLVFKHAGEANEAFRILKGKQQVDVQGRPSKLIQLPGGLKFYIRKSAGHNGFVFQQNGKAVPVRVAEKPAKARPGKAKAKAKAAKSGKHAANGTAAAQPTGVEAPQAKPDGAIKRKTEGSSQQAKPAKKAKAV